MPFFAAMKGNVKALHLGPDYAFRKHPSYHGMIPCLLRSHTYWSVSGGIAHSAVAMPLVGSTGTSNPPTLTLWRSWTLGTQPLRHLREWVQGHLDPQEPRYGTACVALWRLVLQDFYRVGLWLWSGMIWFFFFWLWRWVVNFFWPGMICIPWDFFLYRIGEVRLFTQGYFVRNKWKQITTQFWGTAWKCCWNLTLFYLHLVL